MQSCCIYIFDALHFLESKVAMRALLAVAIGLLTPVAYGASVDAVVSLTGRNLELIDSINGGTTFVDTYSIGLTNPNALPVTSVELRLPGDFVQGSDTARDTSAFADLGGGDIADTFIVAPSGLTAADLLLADVIDSGTSFEVAYSVNGGGVIVPAAGSAAAAVLAVPTGFSVDPLSLSGFAVTGNVGDDVSDVLESLNFSINVFGDSEPDGDVDIIDFGLFADNFGLTGQSTTNPVFGDSEPDGDVDIIDFGLFADNFGFGSAAVAVPEPSAAVVSLLGLAALGFRRNS